MTTLIGLTGFKRSGKNTAGEILAEHYTNATVFGLADKLKIFAARSLGFVGSEHELIALMDDFKESSAFAFSAETAKGAIYGSLTGRQLLQNIGTEGARDTFDKEFWLNLVLPQHRWREPTVDRLAELYPDSCAVIVTDIRFDNEAQRIRDLGGVVWQIDRDGTGGDGHASETGVSADLIDLIIDNNGDLDNLRDGLEVALDYAR